MPDERITGAGRLALGLPFTRADLVARGDRKHEHPAVADLSCLRRAHDRLDRRVDEAVADHGLDLHLWQETDVVFLATIDRRVALLLTVSTHLGDGHAGDANL